MFERFSLFVTQARQPKYQVQKLSLTLHINQTAWSCFINGVQHRKNQTEAANSKVARFPLFFSLCMLAKLLQSCQTL